MFEGKGINRNLQKTGRNSHNGNNYKQSIPVDGVTFLLVTLHWLPDSLGNESRFFDVPFTSGAQFQTSQCHTHLPSPPWPCSRVFLLPRTSSPTTLTFLLLSSVQFSGSVVSDSLRPHEPQHTRPPCPSPTPRVQPNPCPSSR